MLALGADRVHSETSHAVPTHESKSGTHVIVAFVQIINFCAFMKFYFPKFATKANKYVFVELVAGR